MSRPGKPGAPSIHASDVPNVVIQVRPGEDASPQEEDSRQVRTPLYRHADGEPVLHEDAHDDPLAGTNYRTSRCLGGGGMAEVLLAEDLDRGEPVVVKLLRSDVEPELADRLRLEADVLMLLDHPNIVRIFRPGTTPRGRPYIVMERLFGRTLREEIDERGPLPIEEAVDLTSQILDGLGAAHARGLLHRDIKLDNIFLCDTPDGRIIKILDFGLTKSLDDVEVSRNPTPLMYPTKQGEFVGTPRYMAPEQVLGRADRRADLYAVALVFYSLVAGHQPFPDVRGMKELLLAHRNRNLDLSFPERSDKVPRQVVSVLEKALEKNPNARFGSAAEFRTALAGQEPELIVGHADESSVSVRLLKNVPARSQRLPTRTPSWAAPKRPHVFEPGDMCGKYQIESLLASGGVGEIYIAKHTWNGRRVAIKVLQSVYQHDATTRKRMEREAKLLCELQHPNIVHVIDADVTPEGLIFIIMELHEGETLRQLLNRRGRLSPADALHVATQVSKGIAYAHDAEVVHRDLKPENILIDSRGWVIVLDFGIAQWKDQGFLTDPSVALGTPIYMSPEQLSAIADAIGSGRILIDERTDIYSLALVTHEMIIGRPVWLLEKMGLLRMPHTTEVKLAHAMHEPPRLLTLAPALPELVGTTIDRALAKNPADRFATMGEFGVELRRARWACLEKYPDVEILWPDDAEMTQVRRSLAGTSRDSVASQAGPSESSIEVERAKLPPAPPRVQTFESPSSVRPTQDDTAELPAIARARIEIGGRLDASWRSAVASFSRAMLQWMLLISVGAAFCWGAWLLVIKAYHLGQAHSSASREDPSGSSVVALPVPPLPASSASPPALEVQPSSTVHAEPSMTASSPVAIAPVIGSASVPSQSVVPPRHRPGRSINPYKVDLSSGKDTSSPLPRTLDDGWSDKP